MLKFILPTYSRININFSHGKGVWLYSDNKKKYLDFTSGIAVNSLGHSHPLLINVLHKQSKKLWHTSNLYRIKEQEKLAEKLCKLSFANKVFFCNSGAEATDGLIKIVRKYHFSRGDHSKTKIIVFDNAFHGRTLTGILAGSSESHRVGFLPHKKTNGGFIRVKLHSIKEIEKSIDNKVAGVFIEPIQGEGGINVADIEFLKKLRILCNKKKILLAFDEVQSGIGRTGKMFAYQWSKIEPDIMGLAKGLGGGFPVGAILVSDKVAKSMEPGMHGSTFGGGPLASAVAFSVLKEISKSSFLKNVNQMGTYLKKELEKLVLSYPEKIISIKGKGLILGIECKKLNQAICDIARKKGLLLVAASNNVVRLLPPLIIKKKEIDIALRILDETFKEVN